VIAFAKVSAVGGRNRIPARGASIISKLSGRILAQARVIAKGKRIRDVARLVRLYGGRESNWTKKSSPVFELEGEDFEYHWYEHTGIGKVELKRKRVNRP
jgi:hypothetical protein